MDFTFGILSYNSEKYILETLNSIKYQIIHYGNGLKIQLIVADDGSKDNTCYYVRKWTEKNGQIFERCDFLFSKENEGTVKNYNKLIAAVLGKRFSMLAGDDLYADCNLFQLFDRFHEKECLSSFPISLQDGRFFIETHRLARSIYTMKHKKRDGKWLLRKEMLGSYIHTPSTLFYLQDYDKETKRFVEQFELYEDDPKWYRFLKKGIKFKFILEPFVLYRYHATSISHGKGQQGVLSAFERDSLKLNQIYLSESEISWFLKVFLQLKIKQIQSRKRSFLYLMFRQADYLSCCFFNVLKGYGKEEKRQLEKIIEKNKSYYRRIVKESNRDQEQYRGEKNAGD